MELLISGAEGPPAAIDLSKTPFSVGRSVENDLAYPDDPWLSRYHLVFEQHESAWFVRDCASRNGTVVNATTLSQPHKLRSRDRIYAGHLTIEVHDLNSGDPDSVISFVQASNDRPTHETTFTTSLDKVLKKTTNTGQYGRSTPTSSARVISALVHAGQEVAGHRPLSEVFAVILNLALSAVEAKRGVIMTLEEERLVVKASQGEGFVLSTAVRDRVLRDGASLTISDAQNDSNFREQKSIVMHRVRSMMAVPLQTGDRIIGLIYVDNAAVLHPFSPDDLDLLTVMSNVAAIRIEHARLAAIEEAEKMTAFELQQASEIQRNLLPVAVPVYEGYDLAGFNAPCRTVGGDYYDFVPYADGRLGLAVGDVSGKGLPAALLMSSLQAKVQMLAETTPDPATAITTLNKSLRCPVGKFITFVYAVLDPATGRLLYSNAGHNCPFIIRANGEVETLKGHGMVMGIVPGLKYELSRTILNPGDLLAMYSDGVTEACTATGHEFGEDGLAKFLVEWRGRKGTEIVNGLIERVQGWCGESSFKDDFTVLLVKHL